jgi:hypothetical protein
VGAFALAVDERDPGSVLMTGRVTRTSQAALATALSDAAGRGRCRIDLTGLDGLHAAAVEVLLVLAAEVDLELVVAQDGPVERAVRTAGLDRLATVRLLPPQRSEAQPGRRR